VRKNSGCSSNITGGQMNGLLEIYYTLLNTYGQRHWWPAQTPFEMMVGAILTQNTTWLNVEKAISNFGEHLSPEVIASASNDDLAQIVRPSGYYNKKAIKLKALTQWFGKYSYDVQQTMKIEGQFLRRELLAVKGVGPETADSILLYALNKPFFVVDAYTRRILYRLGYDLPKTYDGLRLNIEESIPQDIYLYGEFHALIVEHAKRHCRKAPTCEACPVEPLCKKRVT
jgi:endonuclease III related protein